MTSDGQAQPLTLVILLVNDLDFDRVICRKFDLLILLKIFEPVLGYKTEFGGGSELWLSRGQSQVWDFRFNFSFRLVPSFGFPKARAGFGILDLILVLG